MIQAVRRRISRHGLKFIAKWEGFRSCPYQDSVGVWTIGYGHTHGVGRSTACISERKARRLLRRDAAWANRAVNDLIDVPLNQNQHDALVSFTFNLGAGALEGSGLRKELNAGRYGRVPAELRKWVFAGGQRLEGLERRRAAEARLFRK